jgi:hypothetical protein
MVWYGRLVASTLSAMHADELDAHDGLHGTFQSMVRRTMALRGEPALVTTSPSLVTDGGFEQSNPLAARGARLHSRPTSGPSLVATSEVSSTSHRPLIGADLAHSNPLAARGALRSRRPTSGPALEELSSP